MNAFNWETQEIETMARVDDETVITQTVTGTVARDTGLGYHPGYDKESEGKYVVCHLASGRTIGKPFACEWAAQRYIELIAPLLDWKVTEQRIVTSLPAMLPALYQLHKHVLNETNAFLAMLLPEGMAECMSIHIYHDEPLSQVVAEAVQGWIDTQEEVTWELVKARS